MREARQPDKEADNVMEAKAHAKYIRISPRKVKIVCDLIRGQDVYMAQAILKQMPNASAAILLKLVNSAAANAENNHDMDPENLFVSETYANPGPILKRIRPVSKGRAHRINKRTSHVTVVLSEKE
jgi:large subunit ribosomal protein L22